MSEKYNDYENEMNLDQVADQPDTAEPVQAQETETETEQAAVSSTHDFSLFEEPKAQEEAAQPEQSVNNTADYASCEAPKPQEPVYTNPYTNPYQAPKPAYTERSSNQSTSRQETPYNDGFYHKSFTRDQSGSNVNYTAPSYHYPTPQQAAPAPSQPRKKEKRGLSRGGVALLLVVCLLISGAAGFGGSMLASHLNKQQYESTDSDSMVIHKVNTEAQVAGTENLVDKTTSQITSEVADTVVEITTEVVQTKSFYGQYIAQGAGSGVIISADGYILTNNHVIDGASSIKVTTRDGDSYDAKLIGADSEVDIALLKIDAKDLPVAVMGDSSKLNVGDKAVIIGNPLGTLGGSVTEGIISALDRSIAIDGKTMHLMQTDAAINPGNSGGDMFNGQGELAGIVVAKSSSSSESIDNIGFVIPINSVLDILGDLKDYGYVRGRASTGMSFIDLTNQMYAWYYFGNSETGVYISSVDSGSNAEKAGFRVGDRVVSVDGHAITSASEIETAIREKSAGDKVTFELNRSGSTGKLELTLEEEVPESSKSSSKSGDNSSNSDSDPFGGFGGGFGFGR